MAEVKVEVLNDRIYAKSDRRFPGDVEMSKRVSGHKWDKTRSLWSYPKTLASCRILREVYTDMLVVGPALAAWARIEINRNQSMAEFAGRKDAGLQRIPEIAPRLDAAMASRTYQRVGARFLAHNKNVLLADEPTLGKTIQFLGGLIEAENEIGMHLVVAPKSSLKSVWADEIFKWTDFHPFWMPEGRVRRERMLELFQEDEHESRFLIMNPEMLQVKIQQYCSKCEQWGPSRAEEKEYKYSGKTWWPMDHYTSAHNTHPKIQKCDWPILFDIEWASVCVDEAHNSLLGIRGGARTTQAGEGFLRLKTRPGGMRVASTGTPLKGRAINFWPTFHWLDKKAYGSKWAYADSFLEITDNGFGKSIGDIRPEREEALHESLRTIMLRRTKKEVQPDLPEDMTLDHWVEMEGDHAKQYTEITEEGETEMAGGSLSTTGVLAEFTRQKQFSFGAWTYSGGKMIPKSSPKFDLIAMMLEKRGITGSLDTDFAVEGGAHKYIIGSQFTATLDWMEQQFLARGIACLKITGAVTSSNRTYAVRTWQNEADLDTPRILLANTKAGGTALTLDAMCDEMFICDETWVHDDQFQLEGRIRNRDVEKRVAVRTYHYVRTRGTIEEEIADSGLTQDEFQKTLMDRSRGLTMKRREIQK